MSHIKYKYFVLSNISGVVEVLYGGNDNVVTFNTATGSVNRRHTSEQSHFLGLDIGELPYTYNHDYLGVNGVVTCVGLEDGIRVANTGSGGFKYWVYIPEYNPLFNLDYIDFLDYVHNNYKLYRRGVANITKSVLKPLTKKIVAAYKITTHKKIKEYIENGSKGDLYLEGTSITSLPDDLEVGGKIYR